MTFVIFQVRFLRPEEDRDQWFNVFVLHQNRVKHGATNYIPEKFIPSFIDLVVWGHEHECKAEPEQVTSEDGSKEIYILQPGSSVVTQLQQGETADKFCFILQINKKFFKTPKIKLQTVRPFVMEDILVADILKGGRERNQTRAIETYCEARVNSMIIEANDKLNGDPKQPIFPIIRIRVLHNDETDLFNPMRFTQKFQGKVANDDVIMFKKLVGKSDKIGDLDLGDIQDMIMGEEEVSSLAYELCHLLFAS